MPASRKEKDSTNHLEHRSINHPAGPKYLKDLALAIEGDNWFVSVHDNGRGISADAVPKLGTRIITGGAAEAGCRVEVTSSPGSTLVEIRGPLPDQPAMS
jgi:two-component sensor histidine kinase